ncbi:MAG: multiheme c-type cytochrome [Pyrinomonadaceae bacterium]
MIKLNQATKYFTARNRLFFLAAVVAGLIGLVVISFHSTVLAQKRRPRRPPTSTRGPATDYSRFSHATKKHQGACNTCHKVPTVNWNKVRDFPDVADFPGHSACVSCHRQQFFKGARPVICAGCHSKVSPKDDVRFGFPNPAAPKQFLIEFPHDKHQDVIARILRRLANEEQPLFVSASFLYASADDKTKHYNNCEICHSPRSPSPAAPPNGWPDSFVPDAATFKDAPASHAACFNCHWKSQPPANDNCAGCHKLAERPYQLDRMAVPNRLSMKFRHAREQHVAECTTCHINITKSATLRGLKPDVPITACTECHNKDGLRQDVSKELEAIDKNRDFACSYCHTSEVGRRDPPSNHYLIAGREAIKRKDVK